MHRTKAIPVLLCITLYVASNLAAIGQELQWFSSYGSQVENAETGSLMIVPTTAGDHFGVGMVGGTTWDLNGIEASVNGGSDILLFRLNEEGEAQWAHFAGSDCNDSFPWEDRPRYALIDSTTGHLIVTGDYSGNADFGTIPLVGSCTSRNLFVTAYDDDGSTLWASRATGSTPRVKSARDAY